MNAPNGSQAARIVAALATTSCLAVLIAAPLGRVVGLGPATLAAQEVGTEHDAALAAMQELSFLVGDWEGTGTTMTGASTSETSHVTERATWRAGGAALMLEGRGTVEADGRTQVVHEAIGLITWNAGRGVYEMRAFRLGQGWTDTDLTVDGGTLIWGMDTPGGPVRFTVDFSEEDRWREIGEILRGDRWIRFLEMELRRK